MENRRTSPRPISPFEPGALFRYLPKTGTIGAMLRFDYVFVFTPYEPLIPLEGAETSLFFEREASNDALIALRQEIAALFEGLQPDTPQSFQWPLNVET